jgi:hypothetical protein
MPYYRGVAAKVMVYAYDKTTGLAKTGDAANITAYWNKDGGNGAATNDVNPSAVTNMDGYYAFDMLAAEMTADRGVILPVSTTANIIVERKEILTTPQPFLTGSINDASATTTGAITTLTGYGNDFFNTNKTLIVFMSGNLKGTATPITGYVSATGAMTWAALAAAPANNSEIMTIGYGG